MDISSIRKEYKLQSLTESEVASNPFLQFDTWFKEAIVSEVLEANAMVLSTSTISGKPSARVVLLKDFDESGFAFFTNYGSQKGQELLQNPQASLTFFWPQLERQVRLEGLVEKVPEMESIDYFNSRPFESRVGAWASAQSSVITNRNELEKRFRELLQKFTEEGVVPRPDFWGGYKLKPEFVEFWQGRPSRLHDRICYEKKENSWEIFRLAP